MPEMPAVPGMPKQQGADDSIRMQVILLWQWLRLACVLAVCLMLWRADATMLILDINIHRGIATLWGLISALLLGLSLGTELFQRHRDMCAVLLLADALFMGALGTLHGGLLSGVFLAYMPLVMVAGMALPMLWSMLVAAVSALIILSGCLWLMKHGHLHSNTVPYGIFGALLFVTATGFGWLNKMRLHSRIELGRKTQHVFDLQQLNDLIIRNVRTGILVLDDHLRIITTNDSALKLLALSGEDLHNASLDRIPALHEPFEQWRCEGTALFEPIENTDGSCRLSLEFVAMPEALSLGGIVFLQDFAAIQRRAHKIKSQYIKDIGASIAHEMRNPLSAISQASEALQQTKMQEEQGKLADIIQRHSLRLSQIITNTLQAWRHNTSPRAETRTLPLRPWIEDFASEISYSNSTGKRAQIQIDWQADASAVQFDPGHLRQVLTNICDNGLKYSLRRCGEARLRLRVSENPQTGYMLLDVIDYGPGIGDESNEKIFTPARNSSKQGYGLGLYIARELCEANLASLVYKRSENRDEGSIFQIAFSSVQ